MADPILPGLGDLIKKATSARGKLSEVIKYLNKVSGFADIVAALKTNLDAEAVADRIQEVEEAATKTMQLFGSGREHILAIKANLVDSVAEVTRLGKDFKYIADTQNEISDALGRNLIVNSNIYEKMAATEMVTGQGAKELTTAFKNVGFSISHISDEMKTVVDVSRNLGVNAKQVSSQVVQNIESMNKFNFQGGIEGMAKMAAQATSLRVSMKDTLYFAERVYNPEGAIEMASALQRLGVTQSELLDPLRLMDLSLNDPTELQNQIAQMTKSFVQLNEKGKFEIMPGGKLQLQEIANAMKIPYETLTKMALGGAELEEKMQRIRFPSGTEFADENTRQMIANMAELDSKTGEYKVSFTTKEGQAVTKSVTELNEDDLKALENASKPKEMVDLAKEQLDVLTQINGSINALGHRTGYAYAGASMTDKALRAQSEIFSSATENVSGKFEISPMRKMFEGVSDDVMEFLKTDNVDNLKTAFGKITKHFGDIMDETIKDELPKTQKAFENSTNEYVKYISRFNLDLDAMGNKVVKILTDLNIISGGGTIPGPSPGAGGSGPSPGAGGAGPSKASDIVSYPGSGNRLLSGEFGSISLDKRDIILAGDPNKLLSEQSNDNNLSSIVNGFLNGLNSVNTTSTQTIKNEGDFKISLDINVNSNNNSITSDQMERILEDRGIIASIKSKLDELSTNIGRTSPRNPIEYNKNIVNQQYNTELS